MPVRIYELAHEFDMPSKEMVEFCRDVGLDVKSHSSTIEDDEADMVRRRFHGEVEEPAPEPAPAAEAAPPAEPGEAEVEPEPEPRLSVEARIERARSLRVPLPLARPRRPKAEGIALLPVTAAAEVAVAEPPEPEATPLEAAAQVEVAEEAVAETEVEAVAEPAAPEAEAVVEAEAEAPAEAAETEAVEAEAEAPAEAAEAEAAVEPEAAPAEAAEAKPEAEETAPPAEAAATTGEPPARPRLPRRPARPGPKLAPRPKVPPKPGPKVAPKPTRPPAHPQAVGADAPPEHPQAVGHPPAAGRGRGAGVAEPKGPKVPEPHPEAPEAPTTEKEATRKGRKQGKGRETEEEAGRKKRDAFRRRERSRHREDVEFGADLGPGESGAGVTERGRVGRTGRPRRGGRRPARGGGRPPRAAGPKKAEITPPITVKSLSAAIGVKASDIIRFLMVPREGREPLMAKITDALDVETAEEIGIEFDVDLTIRAERRLEDVIRAIEEQEDPEKVLQPRQPVVTFLGHVDHGKTSLMDRIRQTHVVDGEAGGITQHIGAYRVPVGEKWVAFLDTPGHAAFTAMRARGAHVTDVVVLVVAADDSVMPQTEEAINHARAAGVPLVVAINKCDLPSANPQRVRTDLTRFELVAEEFGGQTIMKEVSAVTGQGIDDLLESLLLEAELLELKANPDRAARGTVIEAQRSEGLGPVATLLVQNGTLKAGDVVLAGTAYGKVRRLTDEAGRRMHAAGPAVPVQVAGLSDPPQAGEKFYVLDDIQTAKDLAEARQRLTREAQLASLRKPRTLEAVFEQMTTEQVRELPIVLKADVQGSVEAIRDNLEKIEHPEVAVRVIHTGVGGVNESDVLLADASDAVIIGFNAVPDPSVRALAEERGVDVRHYRVIYRITEDVRQALEGMLKAREEERRLGEAEVQDTFKISRIGTVAGCICRDGTIPRAAQLRIIRDGLVVHEGRIDTLKRFQDDVREVRAGQECGIKVAGFDDIKLGDRLEAFETVEVQRTLESG